jgi:Fe-S-cluster containining protein
MMRTNLISLLHNPWSQLTGDTMSDAEEGGDVPDGEGEKTSPPKFVYECVHCGHSCVDRNIVEVTLADLRAWAEDQSLASIFPFIRIMAVGRPYLDVVLASDDGAEAFEAGDVEHKGCPMYDADNKLCNIYHSMPLYCRSFPLAFNGTSYFIKDRECQGIGAGSMTQERLEAHRSAAREELEARRESGILMPTLQGIFTRFFVEASAKTLDAMSEDDRKSLEDLLAKQLRDSPGEDDGPEDDGPEDDGPEDDGPEDDGPEDESSED